MGDQNNQNNNNADNTAPHLRVIEDLITRVADHDQRLRSLEVIAAGIPRIEDKMDKLLDSKADLPGQVNNLLYRIEQVEKRVEQVVDKSNGLSERLAKWSIPISILIALIAAGAFLAFGIDPSAVRGIQP